MKNPLPWIAKKLHPKANTFQGKFIWIPLFGLGPAALLGIYTNKTFNPIALQYVSKGFDDFTTKNILVLSISLGILAYFATQLRPMLEHVTAKNTNHTSQRLLNLNLVIQELVDFKRDRFEKAYLDVRNLQPGNKPDIFNTITRPDQQIAFLGASIYRYYRHISPEHDFKVWIVKAKKERLTDWVLSYPQSAKPKLDISAYSKKNSTFCKALKSKSITIVQDVEAELKKAKPRFLKVHEDDGEDIGSLVCFPIHFTWTDVCFVISVSCNASLYFKESKEMREYHKWIFGQFATRLELEYTLSLLKEAQNG